MPTAGNADGDVNAWDALKQTVECAGSLLGHNSEGLQEDRMQGIQDLHDAYMHTVQSIRQTQTAEISSQVDSK